MLTIKQLVCSKQYYDNCRPIHQHIRIQQNDLRFEHRYSTHDWSNRVNFALLGMCIVEVYYMKCHCDEEIETPHEFFSLLADELIDYGRASYLCKIAQKEANKTLAHTCADNCNDGTGKDAMR